MKKHNRLTNTTHNIENVHIIHVYPRTRSQMLGPADQSKEQIPALVKTVFLNPSRWCEKNIWQSNR